MEMANINESSKDWQFKGNDKLVKAYALTIEAVDIIMEQMDPKATKKYPIVLGLSDPSSTPLFITCRNAVKAMCSALYSDKYNGSAPPLGIHSARK